MRWFCLDAIKDRGEKVFLIEADVVCLKENWMMEYPPTESLTLFGTDRACALFCPYKRAMDSLMDLVTFYRNVYEYLIEENIFVGNFDHLMYDMDEHLPEAYRAILAKPKEDRSTEEDERNYLNGITHGLMGIGQRRFFGIHVQEGIEDIMYRHLKQQEWRIKKRKRRTKKVECVFVKINQISMDAKARRAERMAKMKKPESVVVKQIGTYDMSDLHEFTITTLDKTYTLTYETKCAKIKINHPVLYISILNRCGYRGSVTLTKLIAFADKNGLTIELEDESTIKHHEEIDLSLLKIAQTGNTWYGRYGFTNGLDPEEVDAFIHSPYKDSTYKEKAIELGKRLKRGEPVMEEIQELCKQVEDFLKTTHYTRHHKRGGKTRRR